MIYTAEPTLVDLLQICMDARPDEIEQFEALSGIEWDVDVVVNELFVRQGFKFALLDDDKVFSVGGWQPVIDGVWQSWMIGTAENWEKYWRSITRISRLSADYMFQSTDARRLQIAILSTREKACEWCVRGLKFEYESTMKNFGIGGADVVMYRRLKE